MIFFFHSSLYNIKFQLTIHVQMKNVSAHINSNNFLLPILALILDHFVDHSVFLLMRDLGVLPLCLQISVYLGTTLKETGRGIREKRKSFYIPCTE